MARRSAGIGGDLAGKVVAVTGGGRGIGRATCQALSRAEAEVAIGDLDVAAAQGVADSIGGDAIALPLDVTDRGSFEGFVRETEDRLGPLDALVNNAGVMCVGSFLDESDAAVERMIKVNVDGVLNGMKLALPGMVARGRGHLVNIGSTASKVGVPGVATYCGTKFFVYGVSEAAQLELRGTGVAISCVMPGAVRTELTSGFREQRLVTVEPEEVAQAIVATLRRPRFDVFAPRLIGPVTAMARLVPRRAREAISRAVGADSFFFDYVPETRSAYNERIGLIGRNEEPPGEPEE